jgi:hypothetical protein
VRATFRYVLLTAVRDRFPLVIAILLLAVTAVGLLIAASTLTEGRQAGLAYGGELSRVALVLGFVIFVCFHVRNLHETREIEAILTRPISRASFVLAYYGAFALLSAVLAIVAGVFLAAALGAWGIGLLEWLGSMVLELSIACAMALFCAMALNSATGAVLTTLGFYLLARTMEYFLSIAQFHTGTSAMEGVNQASEVIMTVIALVVPRLDLFGQSRWLVYGPGGGWGVGVLLLQTAIYVPLLLLATTRDLRVRRF